MKINRVLMVGFVLTLALGATFQPMPVSMKAFIDDKPNKAYLPIIRNTVPPERLGPYGAKVTTVVYHPTNPDIVYAGTWGNGIFKSVDSGNTWFPSSAGLSNLMVQSLAISPSRPNALYAGVYYQENGVNGVFKTINSGASWFNTGRMVNTYDGQSVERPIVYALAVHPWDSDVVYAATRMSNLVPGQPIYGGGGVFKTVDGGVNWNPVNNGLPPNDLYIYDLTIDPIQPDRVYAVLHESGIYKTETGGNSWVCINSNIPHDPTAEVVSSGRAVVLDPQYTARLYYGTYHRQGIFSTTNRGVSWYQDGMSGYKIVNLALDPSDPKIVYATTNVDGVFITTNQGGSWELIRPAGPGHTRMAINPLEGRNLLVGTDSEGIFRSSDRGENWSASYHGVSGYPVYSVVIDPANPQILYAAVFGRGVYKSTNRGASWVNSSSGLGDVNITDLVINPTDPAILYASTASAGVYWTTNAAGGWGSLNTGYPTATSAFISENVGRPLPVPEMEALDDENEYQLDQVPASTSAYAYALGLGISPANPTQVLLGTSGRGISRILSGVWNSTNISSGTVYGFLYDNANSSFVYAGAGTDAGGVLKSLNGGATWAVSNNGLAGRTVFGLAKSGDGALYAGTDQGVYRSLDGGTQWLAYGLENEAILAIHAPGGNSSTVYAGTANTGYVRHSTAMNWSQMTPELANMTILDIVSDPGRFNFYYFGTRLGGIVRINDAP